ISLPPCSRLFPYTTLFRSSRVNDCEAKLVITSDGGYRGNKTIDLKGIVDEALEKCPLVENVLVVNRTNTEVQMKEGRDQWIAPRSEEHTSELQSRENIVCR